MKAIAVTPDSRGMRLVERPEPSIAAPTDVKLRVLQVGICGTDREETAGGRARAPDGVQELVLGHEMVGQVVDMGPSVTRVSPGDFAALQYAAGVADARPVP